MTRKRPPPAPPSAPSSRKRPCTPTGDNPAANRDRLSTLPTEIILLIARHLPLPRTAVIERFPAAYEGCGRVTELKFQHHRDLLALSRTCKRMHTSLSQDLFEGLLQSGVDLLKHAVDWGSLGLAKRLLEEGHVEATDEQVWYCLKPPGCTQFPQREKGYGKESLEMRKEVLGILVRMGAGRTMREQWAKLMITPWPAREWREICQGVVQRADDRGDDPEHGGVVGWFNWNPRDEC